MRALFWLRLWVTAGLYSSTALAAVHPYNKDYFYRVADAFIFRGGREGLYASSAEVRRCDAQCPAQTSALRCRTYARLLQALRKWADFGQVAPGVANGQSEIRLDKLEFHRPAEVANEYGQDESWTGLIQAVIFEVNDRDKIGYSSPEGYYYCCVKELRSKTKCHLDRLIYKVYLHSNVQTSSCPACTCACMHRCTMQKRNMHDMKSV